MYYNCVCIHQTLKVSPAMAAGVTDRLWEMNDVREMIEAFEASRKQARLAMNRDTPEYWRMRAGEARSMPEQMSLLEAKQTMLEIAADYERLAEIADRHASKE